MITSNIRFLSYCFLLLTSLSSSQNNDSTKSDDDDKLVGQPKIIYQPKLTFPDMARQAGLEATVHLKMAIGKNGKPYKTVITKREPEFVYMFDDEVRRFAMGYEFTPGLNSKGEQVSFWITLPVNFKLYNFEPPITIEQPKPEYPIEALEMGLEGWVGLAVLIERNGRRDGRPLILSREPANTKIFDDAAIEVAMNSTFKAATNKGRETNGWVFMKVEFKINPK